MPGTTAATASAPGDVAGAGSGTEFSLAPHKHGREAYGTAESTSIGTKGDGLSAHLARADHGHDHPAGLGVDLHHTEIHKPVKHTFVGVRVRLSADQSIASSTSGLTAVAWDVEDFDTDAIHDVSTNKSHFVVPTGMGGKWRFESMITWPTNNSGGRYALFRVNGVTQYSFVHIAPGAGLQSEYGSDVLVLAAGDYVEVMVQQSSGSALSVQATATPDSVTTVTASYACATYLGA